VSSLCRRAPVLKGDDGELFRHPLSPISCHPTVSQGAQAQTFPTDWKDFRWLRRSAPTGDESEGFEDRVAGSVFYRLWP
jgi:hypothetical protein